MGSCFFQNSSQPWPLASKAFQNFVVGVGCGERRIRGPGFAGGKGIGNNFLPFIPREFRPNNAEMRSTIFSGEQTCGYERLVPAFSRSFQIRARNDGRALPAVIDPTEAATTPAGEIGGAES